MSDIDLLGRASDTLDELVRLRGDAPPALALLALGEGPCDPDRVAIDAAVNLLAFVAGLMAERPADEAAPLRLAAVFTDARPARADAHAEAAVEALRAIVHSLTLELGPTGRLSLILADTPACEALPPTLAALADPALSASLAGATIDLRSR